MNQRKPEAHVFQDGTYLVDGGALFAGTPKVEWQEFYPVDERNRIRVGINYFLINSENTVTLIDTGMGTKLKKRMIEIIDFKQEKSLIENLKSIDICPADITQIIFTHLHYDHAGGATKFNDKKNMLIPSFPKATTFIQKEEWKAAINPDEISRSSYKFHDFMPLSENENLKFVSGSHELSKGIHLQVTGGHTAAHQMVIFKENKNTYIFPGDICPTEFHLELDRKEAFDLYPKETLRARKNFLRMALQENTFVAFSHSLFPGFFKLSGTIQSCKAQRI